MIGSRNHFGGDRPIRAGQASPPGGTEGGERKEHVRSRLLKKGGHIFVQGRLLWWWGTTSVETSPLPRGPPPSCLNWPTGSFAPGRNHREGQFPPLLRAQRRISRDTFPHDHHRTLPHSRNLHGARGLGGFVSHGSPMCQSSVYPWCPACIISSALVSLVSKWVVHQFRIEGGSDDF